MPSGAAVRQCMSDPGASAHFPEIPSAGILTPTHLAASPEAVAGGVAVGRILIPSSNTASNENGYNFLYPQIDWGGNSPGYVETEFPVYSFVVALFYKIFGVHEFLGRLLSAVLFLIALYFLYLLVLKYTDKNIALWSCAFFAILPPIIFYTRAFHTQSS